MSQTCAAVSSPATYWNFCPSLRAAYTLLASFALTTLGHTLQAFLYRKPYSGVLIIGALAQTLAYIFRVLSIQNPGSEGDYAAWFVLILVAPILTNAFVYMVVGRMIWNYTESAQILKIKAWRFGSIFVLLDLFAAIIQIWGAASAATRPKGDIKGVLKGIHIYEAGVGIQQAFIFLFLFFAIRFHFLLLQRPSTPERKQALVLLYTIYVILCLITTRIIFRLIEYKDGLDSKIPNQEVYQYCLDSLPMLLAFLILHAVHPGRVMPGKEYDIPSRKERKERKITRKSDVEETWVAL